VKSFDTQTYSNFVASLKKLSTIVEPEQFPQWIVLTGDSDFLRYKACERIKAIWATLTGQSPMFMESLDLDGGQFQSLWSQRNLFEPEPLYILRRAHLQRQLSTWLGKIKQVGFVKSHFLIDCGEKISTEIKKQSIRLNATIIPCVEPTKDLEIIAYINSLSKRLGVTFLDDAAQLILNSVGRDLSKISNQVQALSLEFCSLGRPITRKDILHSVGQIREDDVFNLFGVLRNSKAADSYLLLENFLNRGESAIALTGILSRFAREQIERGAKARGLSGLKKCAYADQMLKSSKIDDVLLLADIVSAMSEAKS
jgi:DNA polymerase III delta subunit